MGTVSVDIEIEASPETVWSVLSDVGGWEDWNQVMVGGRCDGGQGAHISCRVAVGPIWFPVKSIAHTWSKNEALVWGEDRGRWLQIHHGFRLNASPKGTHIEHFESFEGWVGRAVYPLVQRSLNINYLLFLEVLKQRVEAPS